MPQRRFKFKLCRLARGERSLDSLPIILLLLPSPSLFLSRFLPPLFILFSLSAVYFLRSSLARVNCRLSLLLSVLFAPVKVPKKKFHVFSLYMCVCFFWSACISLFCIQLPLIRGFFFFRGVPVLFVSDFFFWTEEGFAEKNRASFSPRRQRTVAGVWCFVCVFCRFSCSLWAWCEREAEECLIPQSACCFRCAFSFMWDLEIVW